MTYLEWNNIISEYFFNPSKAGKNIHLYMTKTDIIHLAEQFNDVTEKEIWVDFTGAIRRGLPGSTGNVTAKAKYAYGKRNLIKIDSVEIKYPPYLAYLAFFVLPLTEGIGDAYSPNNYYDRLNEFLRANQINETIGTNDFRNNQINCLWEDLGNWANDRKSGDLGLFKVVPFKNSNWIYVGKVFSQCIFPPRAIKRLSDLFLQSGMVPNSNYSSAEIKSYLLQYGSSILQLSNKALNTLRSESNELGQSIIDVVNREYKKWTGETHEDIEEGQTQRKKRNYTIAPLFLQFKVNTNDEEIIFSYRMYSQNDYPEDLKFGEHEDLYETIGWSKTLPLEFKDWFELKDDFNKWIARFPERDVRLFVNAGTKQLSASYWIETDVLSKIDPMYLLCKNEKSATIEEWGKSFGNGNFKQEDFDGLPENHSLFWFRNPIQSCSEIQMLTLCSEKQIELIGGLKVNFRTYINDFLPEIEVVNADGNEKVYLQYKETDEKIYLSKNPAFNNCWLLPTDILLNVDFYLKVENEIFSGNEIAYNIASSNNSASRVEGSQLPKRDSFGRYITIEAAQYCLGSNLINPNRRSAKGVSPYTSLFTSINQEIPVSVSEAIFNNHCGNMLCAFLSLKSVLTTEEFFKAFEFYYSKEFSDAANTKLKKASLSFYDFIGMLDYDYETKKIVLNPPQLIFVPAKQGRKVLLIGARDSAFIEAIIKTAPKHNLQVEIIKQFSSNEKLLLPDAITIKAFGTENFGENNLKAFADELQIKFSNDYFPQIALQEFSANITDYENSSQLTDENDYDWARKIFNPETLSFEKSETPFFDKSFSLVEYKLNEYTYYYKLWKENQCYQIDKNWGKFIALKHFNKNVVLFDTTKDKVAIPLETPLPRLLSEAIMLLSGLAPDFKYIEGKIFRIYENIPSIFTQNLFQKLGQKPTNKEL